VLQRVLIMYLMFFVIVFHTAARLV